MGEGARGRASKMDTAHHGNKSRRPEADSILQKNGGIEPAAAITHREGKILLTRRRNFGDPENFEAAIEPRCDGGAAHIASSEKYDGERGPTGWRG